MNGGIAHHVEQGQVQMCEATNLPFLVTLAKVKEK